MKPTYRTRIGLLALAADALLGCSGFRAGMHRWTSGMVTAVAGPASAREASSPRPSSAARTEAGPPSPTAGGAPAAGALASDAPFARPVASSSPAQDEQAAPAQTTAGTLTAATVGDHDRRGAYLEYMGRHSDQRARLQLDLSRRVRVRVVDGQGAAVNDAAVAIDGAGAQVAGRTHADGVWDFHPGLYGEQVGGVMNLHVRGAAGEARARVEVPFAGDGADVTVRLDGAGAAGPRALDLGFAIDVTGSMGDELRYVREELASIVRRVRSAAPGTAVRVGATIYRDRSESTVVQQVPFTPNVEGFVRMISRIEAAGGGDYPEDMNAGLDAALQGLQWSAGDAVRVLVVVADAPPQDYADERFTYREAIREASARGIRLVPVAASGADRTVEYLFRAMGASTGAPYVYLTDESGVGEPHMEADTDRVAVERFNDLLTRLIVSDLRGQGMHELLRE
jgi:hypothetical protein